MKKHGSILTWALIISLLLLSLSLVDFLALADIHQDYVSTKVLESFQINVADKLPDWSSTKLEWTWIRASFLLRLFSVVFIFVALVKIAKRTNV